MVDEQKRKITIRQRLFAVLRVLKLSYKTAPSSIIIKVLGAIISAVLPLATTYYAALTTTALAAAYSGDKTAGSRAIMYVIIVALLGLLLLVWGRFEQYISRYVRYRIDVAVTDQMFEHFLSLEFWRYDDKKTADLFAKAQRFSSFFSYAFDSFSGIASQLISVIVGLAALVFVSCWLGLILIASIIPGVMMQIHISREQIKSWRANIDTRRAGSMIEGSMMNINEIAELRLYGVVRHLLNLRNKYRDSDEKSQFDIEKKFALKNLFAQMIQDAAEVAALIFTTLQIIAHAQPIGQFLYVQQIISRAIGGMSGFISQINSIDEDIANLFDYQEFMDLPTSKSRPIRLDHLPKLIEINNVSFKYPGSKQLVLKDVSMKIPRNEHIAIVGENGAGKTTLIKLILGLYNPIEGQILVDGEDLQTIEPETWHSRISVLQQEFIKYSFATARDNVYFGDVNEKFDKKCFDQAIDKAEARDFLGKLPKGFDTYVDPWLNSIDGTPGVNLSGGQWQRLALARNFYRNSPIIILDEPTSAIDALAESRIFKHLFSEHDRTIITISHRLTTVEKADVVFMLENGQLVESGTHQELVAKKGAYYHMFESQISDNDK